MTNVARPRSEHSTTVGSIADRLNAEVFGDRNLPISGASSLSKATANDITFVSDAQNSRSLKSTTAGACIIARQVSKDIPAELFTPAKGKPVLLVVDDALDAFLLILADFRPQRTRANIGVSPLAYVSPRAVLGADCNVYPGAYIADDAVLGKGCDVHPGAYIGAGCQVGDNCVFHPHSVLYPDVTIGDRVILHASATIGADGFGYRFRGGKFEKIPQLGTVRVDNDCEIGACTTVDRGMIGSTVIGEGTKLDNLVMIGHNCELGKHNVLVSQVGFAGSVTTGDYVRCAGHVGVGDHVHLGTGCTLAAKAGVHKDVPAGETQVGVPAGPVKEQFRVVMAMQKLPEMKKQLELLTRQVAELQRAIGTAAAEKAA